MSRPLVCRQARLGPSGLTLDGVNLPWAISQDFDIDDLGMEGSIYGLTVTFFADRVIVDTPTATFDTLIDHARDEAIRIVREGLADVLEWLGEAS